MILIRKISLSDGRDIDVEVCVAANFAPISWRQLEIPKEERPRLNAADYIEITYSLDHTDWKEVLNKETDYE